MHAQGSAWSCCAARSPTSLALPSEIRFLFLPNVFRASQPGFAPIGVDAPRTKEPALTKAPIADYALEYDAVVGQTEQRPSPFVDNTLYPAQDPEVFPQYGTISRMNESPRFFPWPFMVCSISFLARTCTSSPGCKSSNSLGVCRTGKSANVWIGARTTIPNTLASSRESY